MRLRGMRYARIGIRGVALFSFPVAMSLIVACSGGGDEGPEPTATPGRVQATPQVSPTGTASVIEASAPGPVIVATPRPGTITFNDPDRSHTISGFAVNSTDGSPVRGVHVRERQGGASGTSDEFGFYRIDGLDPGFHDLDISGYRVEPLSAEIESETWTRLDLSVSVTGDPATRLVFDVIGTVTNRDSGEPIANAVISATGDETTIEATTDDSGAYVIAAAPEGGYSVSITSSGYPVYTEEIDVTGDIAWEVFLRAPPSTIKGHVSGDGPPGTRLPVGSSVRVIDMDSVGTPVRAVATSRVDSTGAYVIDGLAPGRYRVEAIASGYQSSQVIVELSGGNARELDFGLSVNGSSLFMTLTSSTYNHVAVADTTLRIQGVGGTTSEGVSLESVTDQSGLASIVNIPAGAYDVWTPGPVLKSGSDSADLYPLHRTLTVGSSETLTLNADLVAIPGDVHGFIRAGDKAGQTRLGTLVGTTFESSNDDGHEPFSYLPTQLAQANVEVTSARFGTRSFAPRKTSVISDGFGNYVLPLPPGTYDLTVTSDGYVTTTTDVTITSSPTATDIQLQKATTAIVGRVNGTMIQDLTHLVDADFVVSGARVLLRRDENVWAGETDSRGVFSIEDIPLTMANGATIATEYQLEITHTDYLPINETLNLSQAEGAFRIERKMPTLAAGAFLNISIAVTDKNGTKTAAVGTLESLQNLRTMDVYDARFIKDTNTVEIPNSLSIRARPGEYRARICPDVIGMPRCFDHFWTSIGGDVDELALSINCGESDRIVKCSLDGGIPASPSGHIQTAGFIRNASTGLPVPDAKVNFELQVLTEYCSQACTGFVREFSATGPTGPNGRYQLQFEIPETNGGADLTNWSWAGADRLFTITAPGYQTVTSTGSEEGVRLFDGHQNFDLAPVNQLNLQIVGASSEANPVIGLRPDLGVLVGGQDRRAKVTLLPTGADLSTAATGIVSFNAPSGSTTVQVDAPGHYPYTANVLVPESPDGDPVLSAHTLQIERVPPPAIQAESFKIVQTSDGAPLKGYVVRGLSAAATGANWSVRVDRNGVNALRNNFEDPVESVALIVHVLEACPGSADLPVAPGTFQLRGTLLSGSSNGVGIWGGVLDVSALPCGTLSWRIEAHTSESVVTHGADWPIWPSEQRYPLSLLTRLSEPGATPSTDSTRSQLGADLGLSASPGSLSITQDGEYLKYEIPNILVETNIGSSVSSRLLEDLTADGSVTGSEQSVTVDAQMDGRSGLLDITLSDAGSGLYSLTAENLFSLDSRVAPPSSNIARWGETISSAENSTRQDSVSVADLPSTLRSILGNLDLSAINGTVTTDVTVDASWDLSPPSENAFDAPIDGERRVVAGTQFEFVSITQFDYATSVMSHLVVDGLIESRSTAMFDEQAGAGDLRERESVAVGKVGTRRELWSVWEDTRDTAEYSFFDRVAGADSVGRSSSVEGSPTWRVGSPSELSAPSDGQAGGIVGIGGISRSSIAAARNEDGTLFLSSVSPDVLNAHPAVSGLSFMETDPDSSTWSSPAPVEFVSGGMVTDTAMVVEPGGDLLLIWSEISDPDEEPGAFIYEATRTELHFSRLDANDGTWSPPGRITADNRPDFSPVVASDNEGRVVAAWARDMDGNVLTADDIVIFASDWIAGTWTPPRPVMSAPGAVSELSLSLANGSAVIGVVTDSREPGRAIRLSFNSLGRWSPPNIIAVDRPGLSEVSVLMQSTGLALVAWNEQSGSTGSRLMSVEATSAGVRGETVAADGIIGLVDLALVAAQESRYLTWTSDGGAALNGARQILEGWDTPASMDIESGISTRLLAISGNDDGSLFTFHQITSDGIPGLMFLPLPVR